MTFPEEKIVYVEAVVRIGTEPFLVKKHLCLSPTLQVRTQAETEERSLVLAALNGLFDVYSRAKSIHINLLEY